MEGIIQPIVYFGSSRPEGHTKVALDLIRKGRDWPLVDLNKFQFSDYDYEEQNLQDDFIPLAESMVEHDPIILVTPIYWYSMTALMKRFLDRWTDLLKARKDLGKQLIGKKMFVVASYGEYPKGKDGFETVFKNTAEYLSMDYGGAFLYYSGSDPAGRAENILNQKWFEEKFEGGLAA